MSVKMNSFDITQPFDFIRTVLIIMGLWNTGKSWKLLQLLHFTLVSGIFCVGLFVAMSMKLAYAKKIEEVTEGLYMTLTMASLMTRFVNFFVKRKRFMTFLDNLRSPLVEPKTIEEIGLFQNIFNNFNRLRRTYIFICWCVIAAGCLASLFSERHQKLPFPAWYPYDWKRVSMHFWIAFTYQTLALISSATTNANFDLAHGYLFLQVSIYYRLVSMRLKAIGHVPFESDSVIDHKAAIAELIKCIRMHQFVTELAQCVQDIWTVPVFVQINVSGIVICFTAFQLTLLSPIADTGLFLSYFLYMGAMVIEILLPCYYGNEITIASEFVCTAAYSSNWTEMPYEYRKLMFFFMESLKRPKTIVAGGYFQVGLKAMTSVLQSAYSLFALIMSMEN